jgi:hypothetical protein
LEALKSFASDRFDREENETEQVPAATLKKTKYNQVEPL